MYRRMFELPPDDPERRDLLNQLSQWRWNDGMTLDQMSAQLELPRPVFDEVIRKFSDVNEVLCSRARVLISETGDTRSVRDLARAMGLTPRALRVRLGKLDPNEAMTRPSERQLKKFTVGGVTRTRRQWALALDLAPTTLAYRVGNRVAQGATAQRALELEIAAARSVEKLPASPTTERNSTT